MGGNGGNGTDTGHGGRGGGWEWPPSVEDDPTWWWWWDGWTYGDKYYTWLYWGYNNYDWETWSQWFDTGDWESWQDWYTDYYTAYLTTTYWQYTPYDAYEDYWEYSGYGGAVYCEYDSSPRFDGCIFENNHSYRSLSGIGGTGGAHLWPVPDRHLIIENAGGAVYAANGSNPEFVECLFSGNSADPTITGIPEGGVDPESPFEGFNDDYYVSFGGAVAHEDGCEPKFTRCEFINNEACEGGGLYVGGSVMTVADCNFVDNTAYHGAGLLTVSTTGSITDSLFTGNMARFNSAYVFDPCNPSVVVPVLGQGGGYSCLSSLVDVIDSVFTNNYATASGGGIYYGGSDEDVADAPLLANCLLSGNTAGRDGGGISVNWYAEPVISNCTITDNMVTGGSGGGQGYGGGLYCSYYSNTTVIDSIIWDNVGVGGAQIAIGSGDEYGPQPSTLEITYSDIGPPYDPTGTPDLNPDGPFAGGSGDSGQGGGMVLVDGATIYEQFDAGQDRVEVIVSLSEPVEIREATDWNVLESVAALRAEIAARQDAVLSSLTAVEFTLRHRYENQAGFSGEVTTSGLTKLLNNPSVAHIEPVRYVQVALAQAIPLANALEARQVYDGTGIAVAIVDTGIDYTHPRLGGGAFPNNKVIGGYDFGNNDADPMPVGVEEGGHGTCCAGISAGDLGTVEDYIGGVAPNAKIYALKASADDSDGLASDATLAAWDWCITHRNDNPDNPIMAMSNSWGMPFYPFDDPANADAFSPAHTIAASNATALGITILAASGNDGFAGQGISWPSAMSNIISVGAVYDTTDQVTGYSNTADNLDILAPADPVYTTDIVGEAGYDPGDYFPSFNGTSSACPFAAGVVASLQSAARAERGSYLAPAEVRNLLVMTGDPVADTKVDITKPRVNLGAAINSLSYGPPIYVEDGCTLNGEVIYDWDPGTFAWNVESHNIEDDPLFIGEYFLSQVSAGQLVDSNCVDTGSDLAGNLGMDTYTTRTDSVGDEGIVDMGYHHARSHVPQYQLNIITFEVEGLGQIDVAVDPEPVDGYYNQYTVVKLTATGAPAGYQVKWIGTNDDYATGPVNYVTMDSDKEVRVTYVAQYRLTVTAIDVDGLPQIEVVLDPAGKDGYYDRNTTVKISVPAPPDPNIYDVSWTGTSDDTSVAPDNYVTMNSDKHVYVTYVLNETEYYAVVCGIADYAGTGNDLLWTVNDAAEFYLTLINSANWSAQNITLLADSYATKYGIKGAIDNMATKLDENDVFVFFFSGHGTTSGDVSPFDELDGLDEYLVTHNFDNIRDDELGDWAYPKGHRDRHSRSG